MINYCIFFTSICKKSNFSFFKDKFFIVNSEMMDIEKGEYVQKNVLFTCIDSDGRDCNTLMSSYKEEDVAFDGKWDYRFRVLYEGFWYGYYCNERYRSGFEE